jgi:DNA polymerase III epsilon subunit-like protein
MFDPYNLAKKNPFENLDIKTICYFDTETTGLHPKNSQIVEIAAIIGDEKFYKKIHLTEETKNKIEQEKQNFVRKTKRDKTIEELLVMTGYHESASDCSEEKALQEFVEFCKKATALLAHNASFDMRMINERCKKYGISTLQGFPVYDTLAFSRRFFIPALITIENTSKNQNSRKKAKDILDKLTKTYYKSGQRLKIANNLSSLIGALRGSVGNWHQAMADVEMLKDLVENFFKLMFDKHYNEIPNKLTFKKYYMRNQRLEDRFKESDKAKAKKARSSSSK